MHLSCSDSPLFLTAAALLASPPLGWLCPLFSLARLESQFPCLCVCCYSTVSALVCPRRVDGRGWAHGDLAKFPQIRMVVVQNSLDMTVFDSDAALLQGQAALKGHAGSGSVVAGYKRTLSPLDSLEVNAVLGLRSLLTVTSNRQLGTYTTGSLSATYSYGQGIGMQVGAASGLTGTGSTAGRAHSPCIHASKATRQRVGNTHMEPGVTILSLLPAPRLLP